MKRSIVIPVAVCMVLQWLCGTGLASPVTAAVAERATRGWLARDCRPMGTALGGEVDRVEAFNNADGEAIYYIVYLRPGGFVIVAADDLIEPIIGFVAEGAYDPSPAMPLGALVSKDLAGRTESVRSIDNSRPSARLQSAAASKVKWVELMTAGASDEGGIARLATGSISDVRVEPLVLSRWGQGNMCLTPWYNYFTPGNYPCGCVATAMAQVMRYWEHPKNDIVSRACTIKVNGENKVRWLRGSDGTGTAYRWDRMIYDPDCGDILEGVEAVATGSLCYDAGLSVGMSYASDGSGASMSEIPGALKGDFQYYGAAYGGVRGTFDEPNLIAMVNPNLDIGSPVILGITAEGPNIGHAVVCDGYGYNDGTRYHHLNMGWEGHYEAWYNLPNIAASDPYNVVDDCIYNIRPTGVSDGEIISGRVYFTLTVGDQTAIFPVPGATVSAASEQTGVVYTQTNGLGMYAFADLKSDTQYNVCASAHALEAPPASVTTGNSSNPNTGPGNLWGVDFELRPLMTLRVDDDAPNDPGPGNMWVSDPMEDGGPHHPFDSIQKALDATMGQPIEISPGRYYESIDFHGRSVHLYSTDGPEATIIDGTGHHHVVQCISGESGRTVLEGFTLTGAGGIAPSGNLSDFGGGMLNYRSSPNVINCIFEGNRANSNGGGMCNMEGYAEITDCTFLSNDGGAYGGGGLDNVSSTVIVSNCRFIGNRSTVGGGMRSNSSTVWVTDSTFSDNHATEYSGGGLCDQAGSRTTLIKCDITGNQAEQSGGGIYSTDSYTTVTRCVLRSNSADSGGGGIESVGGGSTVIDCLLAHNSGGQGAAMASVRADDMVADSVFVFNKSDSYGGAVYNSASNISFTGCTFFSNEGRHGGAMSNSNTHPVLTNCILWGDGPEEIHDSYNGYPVVRYSNVAGGTGQSWFGAGCIEAAPCFVDPCNPDPNLCDLRLRRDSPCIDAGDNASVPSDLTDLDGDGDMDEPIPVDIEFLPRFSDDRSRPDVGCGAAPLVDMGAYEFLPADIDSSREVDLGDLSLFSLHWGESGSQCGFLDDFQSYEPNSYTFEDSYGQGGDMEVAGGRLEITTASDNTASVMTKGTVAFVVGDRLSMDVPAPNDATSVFLMCSTAAGQPDLHDAVGFRIRREDNIRVSLYPGGIVDGPADPDRAKPGTLCVQRVSDRVFHYSIIIDGCETSVGSFELEELAGVGQVHIGAQAWCVNGGVFEFDNLRVCGAMPFGGANLDGDGDVDWDDLQLLVDRWLWGH